jgi:hypothetical protein
MLNSKILTITDDSGFMGIVNTDRYKTFVSNDWTLNQLFSHFVEEINNDHLILWGTGSENIWSVSFVNEASPIESFREFSRSIEVTTGRIFLTNYEDLTMAAQYDDEKIPSGHNTDLFVDIDNGRYTFIIRQLFDPEDYDYEPESQVNFEIVAKPGLSNKDQRVEKVFWSTI